MTIAQLCSRPDVGRTEYEVNTSILHDLVVPKEVSLVNTQPAEYLLLSESVSFDIESPVLLYGKRPWRGKVEDIVRQRRNRLSSLFQEFLLCHSTFRKVQF
jgi:hypothetical protein